MSRFPRRIGSEGVQALPGAGADRRGSGLFPAGASDHWPFSVSSLAPEVHGFCSVMSVPWLVTNECEEDVSALESVAEFSDGVLEDLYQWKSVLIIASTKPERLK